MKRYLPGVAMDTSLSSWLEHHRFVVLVKSSFKSTFGTTLQRVLVSVRNRGPTVENRPPLSTGGNC